MCCFCTKIKKILSIALALTLLGAMFTGCFSQDTPSGTGSYNPPNLVDEKTEPTESEPEATAPSGDTIVGVVTSAQLNIRSTPSTDSKVVGHLENGAEVTIQRVEIVDGIRWGRITEGWVCLEYMDLNTDEPDPTIPEETTNTTEPVESEPSEPEDTQPAAEPEEDADPIMGVVKVNALNIREGAGTDYDAVGELNRGDRVAILEQKGNWGRTKDGWISLKYVYLDGTQGENTASGFITGNGLNIRSGPGTKYESIGNYAAGTKVSILEQIQIGDSIWACTNKGWISMKYVYIPGDTGKHTCTGTITGNELNVRSGPGTNFESIGTMNTGDSVNILEQITVGDVTWGYTGKGWVSMRYVEVDGAQAEE